MKTRCRALTPGSSTQPGLRGEDSSASQPALVAGKRSSGGRGGPSPFSLAEGRQLPETLRSCSAWRVSLPGLLGLFPHCRRAPWPPVQGGLFWSGQLLRAFICGM